jgi:hypothetical protein
MRLLEATWGNISVASSRVFFCFPTCLSCQLYIVLKQTVRGKSFTSDLSWWKYSLSSTGNAQLPVFFFFFRLHFLGDSGPDECNWSWWDRTGIPKRDKRCSKHSDTSEVVMEEWLYGFDNAGVCVCSSVIRNYITRVIMSVLDSWCVLVT